MSGNRKQMLNFIGKKVEQLARERDEYKRQLEECQSNSRSNAYNSNAIHVSLAKDQNSNYGTKVLEHSFADPVSNAKFYLKGGKTRRRKNRNKSRRNRK